MKTTLDWAPFNDVFNQANLAFNYLWQAFNTVFNDWLDLLGADAEENHQAHRV